MTNKDFEEDVFRQLAEASDCSDPIDTVRRYTETYLRLRPSLVNFTSISDKYTVSIASKDDEAENLIRRASLISSTLIVTHTEQQRGYLVHREPLGLNHSYETTLHCPDVNTLGKLISDVKPLIAAQQLVYVPNTTIALQTPLTIEDLSDSTSQLFDLVAHNDRLAQLAAEPSFGSRLAIPLIQIEIPVIENVSIRNFSEIVTTETEAFATLRDFLRRELIELDGIHETREIEQGCAKVEIRLREGLREFRSQMKVTFRRSAVQVTGAALATTAATLMAVSGPALAPYLAILGASGGAVGLAAAANSHTEEARKLKLKPFYLLWLLERKSDKLI